MRLLLVEHWPLDYPDLFVFLCLGTRQQFQVLPDALIELWLLRDRIEDRMRVARHALSELFNKKLHSHVTTIEPAVLVAIVIWGDARREQVLIGKPFLRAVTRI